MQHPIEILDNIVNQLTLKNNRLNTTLKKPDNEDKDNWYMFVPSCFNAALDIIQTGRVKNGEKQLVWTQGGDFSFKQGDTIYDTPHAYSNWSDALKHINICFHVNNGVASGFIKDSSTRNPGEINFKVLVPDKDRSKLTKVLDLSMTQDEFVRLLITGPTGDLKEKIDKA